MSDPPTNEYSEFRQSVDHLRTLLALYQEPVIEQMCEALEGRQAYWKNLALSVDKNLTDQQRAARYAYDEVKGVRGVFGGILLDAAGKVKSHLYKVPDEAVAAERELVAKAEEAAEKFYG